MTLINEEGANPAEDVTPDVASREVATPDANPATSSGSDNADAAKPAETPTLESVIEAALKGQQSSDEGKSPDAQADPDAKAAADATSSTEGQQSGAEGDELPDDPTDEEMADYKKSARRAHRRIEQLLNERKKLRAETTALKADADQFRQIQQYMDQHGLKPEHVGSLYTFGGLLSAGRFEEAYQLGKPYFDLILEATGRMLPQDLHERVQDGDMSEEAARLVVRERYARVQSEQKAQRSEQVVQTVQRTQHVAAIQSATADWEARTKATDPDFDLKADAMKEFAVALVAQRGLPKNAQEAIEYAQAAYEKATSFMAKARPTPKPTRPQPSPGVSQSRATAQSTPSSLEEAIRQGLAAAAAQRG